jgi:hypothetical protein
MPGHIISPETRSVLLLAFQKRGISLRRFSREFGVNAAVLSDILHDRSGHVSLRQENRVRLVLGLPVLGSYEVPACPDCGQVHTGRCAGKPVAAVVILSPGDRVKSARPPRPAWLTAAVANLRALEGRRGQNDSIT